MPRYDLITYTGVLREYKPYKHKRLPLVEYIGITGIDLAIIVMSLVCVTAFFIMFVRWWLV